MPVTSLPTDTLVVFLSHTRLSPSLPDNEHAVKLQGCIDAMRLLAQEKQVDESKVYAWVDHGSIDQGAWTKYAAIGMAYVCE